LCVRVVLCHFLFSPQHLKLHKPPKINYKNSPYNTATSSPSPVSSTHSPTPYEEEPTKSTSELEAQYQNQDCLGLSEPSYQNAAAFNNKCEGESSNNDAIDENGMQPQEPTSATVEEKNVAATASSSSVIDTHLNNNNSQIENNISKNYNIINENNQTLSNNQNLTENNINNNNTIINNDSTDQVYDIPVGEYLQFLNKIL
jgi:hypothetical protein